MSSRPTRPPSRWKRNKLARRRRRQLIAVGVVVALVAAAVVWSITRGDDGPERLAREGSVEVEGAEPLTIDDEPDGYQILYRVREPDSEDRSERVTVARPFESRTETYADAEGEGELLGLDRSAFGRLAVGREENRQVLAIGPVTAGADVRLAPALDEALDRGWLERREQREVAGRRCQVYRAGSSVLGGGLGPPGEPVEEYADACFDESGLLLEEWWVVGGRAIRQRVAIDLDDRAPADVTDDLASQETTVPLDKGGGSIQRIRPDSAPPGTFFVLEDALRGFESVGRYSVIPAQSGAFTDPARRGDIVASTADVWRRGVDLLVLDQGGTLEQRQAFSADPDNPTIDLPLGEGELKIGLDANEVRILRPAGRFVRLYGTVPIDELVTLARSLVETEGNEIVVEDGGVTP